MAETTAEGDIQRIELPPWRVTPRINKDGHLTVEVELDGEDHAKIVMQVGGKVRLDAKVRAETEGKKGLRVKEAASEDMRRFQFLPPPASSE